MVYTEYMLSSGKSPHSSPVSVFVHSLKENANGFKRDRKSWRIKKKYQTFKKKILKPFIPWQVPRMDPALLLCISFLHFSILNHRTPKTKNNNTSRNEKYKKKIKAEFVALQHGSSKSMAPQACGNLATVNIHSQGLSRKKEWEHLLYCVYIYYSICLNIENKV